MRWGIKAPSCVCPVASLPESLLLICNSDTLYSLLLSFTHTSFHLSSSFCSSLVLSTAVLSPIFPLVMLCTFERQTGPLAATQTGSSVCLCWCVSGERAEGDLWHYLYSFKLHQATYRPFFYDCNMRYLTYHCHKVQQTRGRGTRTQRQACIHMLLRRAGGGVGDRCMCKLREVFMLQTHISHPGL